MLLTRQCVFTHIHAAPAVQYPLLVSHHTRVAALPGIKEYLASPARVEKVNGNGLG